MSSSGRPELEDLMNQAAAGERRALARLLSLVERGGDPARRISRLALARAGRAYLIGITGSPGAGKSTLAGRLIATIRSQDGPKLQVGVLAIDPSSPYSGGAILGDRVRMQEHALDDGVFIRSMASRGHQGGLSLAVPAAARVLDAAGMDVVLIETVGVGQVEVEVASAADTTVVVVTPGWGDGVQAAKAGLLEAADVFAVNKADRPGAREAERDLRSMLDLSPSKDWLPPVVSTVAATGEGVEALWQAIGEHRTHLEAGGGLAARRAERIGKEVAGMALAVLERRVHELLESSAGPELTLAISRGDIDCQDAAELLVQRVSTSSLDGRAKITSTARVG
ncbi:MAG: methylmalonyl Co-A mutase-associated GTPase MeaB [Actinobacteria bacterium]|nr:methylmalonyl Co-A mutase-associated GTPase MeaB [Actinomycetota bacterium]